jgi:hypothetical protein
VYRRSLTECSALSYLRFWVALFFFVMFRDVKALSATGVPSMRANLAVGRRLKSEDARR